MSTLRSYFYPISNTNQLPAEALPTCWTQTAPVIDDCVAFMMHGDSSGDSLDGTVNLGQDGGALTVSYDFERTVSGLWVNGNRYPLKGLGGLFISDTAINQIKFRGVDQEPLENPLDAVTSAALFGLVGVTIAEKFHTANARDSYNRTRLADLMSFMNGAPEQSILPAV